jgi:hypothetical protein
MKVIEKIINNLNNPDEIKKIINELDKLNHDFKVTANIFKDYYLGNHWTIDKRSDEVTKSKSGKEVLKYEDHIKKGEVETLNVAGEIVDKYIGYIRGDDSDDWKIDNETAQGYWDSNKFQGKEFSINDVVNSGANDLLVQGRTVLKVVFDEQSNFKKVIAIDPTECFVIYDYEGFEEDVFIRIGKYEDKQYAEIYTNTYFFKFIDGISQVEDINNKLGFIPYTITENKVLSLYAKNEIQTLIEKIIDSQDNINLILTLLGVNLKWVAFGAYQISGKIVDLALEGKLNQSLDGVMKQAEEGFSKVGSMANKFLNGMVEKIEPSQIPSIIMEYIYFKVISMYNRASIPMVVNASGSLGNMSEFTINKLFETMKKGVTNYRRLLESLIKETSQKMIKNMNAEIDVLVPEILSENVTEKLEVIKLLEQWGYPRTEDMVEDLYEIANIEDATTEVIRTAVDSQTIGTI